MSDGDMEAIVTRVCWLRKMASVILCAVSARAVAQTSSPNDSARARDISEILRPIREKAGLPGMVGAILAGERLVAIGADGVRKRGAPDAITIDDQIHIGSDT
ncbi:MAG TPA: hypothetical protein VGM03_08915, partial [Phycisphaerae bacterium]